MRKHTISLQTAVDADVDYALRRIALESNIVSNAVALMKDVLPDFISNLTGKNEIVKLAASRDVMNIHALSDKDIMSIFNTVKKDYLNYADKAIVVPENFSGNYLAYVQLMKEALSENSVLLNKILDDYYLILSSFLTNKFARVSMREHDELLNRAKNFMEDRVAVRADYFKGRNDQILVPMNKVVNNSTELENLLVEFNSLLNVLKNIDIKQIERRVDKIVSLLNIIYDEIRNNKTDKISGNMAKTISEGSYNVAKSVEAFVTLHYDSIKLVNAIRETIKRIK
jgi:hypothetical protein